MDDGLSTLDELALRKRNAQLDKGKRKHVENDPTPPERAQRGSRTSGRRGRGGGSFVYIEDAAYDHSRRKLRRNLSPLDFTNSSAASSEIIFGSPTLDEQTDECSTAGSTPGDEEIIFVECKNNQSDARTNRSRDRDEVEIFEVIDSSSMAIYDQGPPPELPFPKSSIVPSPQPLTTPPRIPPEPLPFILSCDDAAMKEYRAGTEYCANLNKSRMARRTEEKMRRFPLEPRVDPSNCIVVDAHGAVVLEDFVDYRGSRVDHLFCLRRRAGVRETLDSMHLSDILRGRLSKHVWTKPSSVEDWRFVPEEDLVWGAESWWNSNAWELYERLCEEVEQVGAKQEGAKQEVEQEEAMSTSKPRQDDEQETEAEIVIEIVFDITSAEGRFLAWSKEPSTIARNERSRLRQEQRNLEEIRLRRIGIVLDVDVEI